MQQLAPDVEARARSGKYITFILAEETYAIDIMNVREIVRMMRMTGVPNTPRFIRGVINLRGKIIPVIDLRMKLNMHTQDDTRDTCILITEVAGERGNLLLGSIVDKVCDVVQIVEQDIEKVPSFGFNINTEFLLGMARSKNGVNLLLNIQKVLSQQELSVAASAGAEAAPEPELPEQAPPSQ